LRDQELRVDLASLENTEQHRRAHSVDEARGDRDIPDPESLEVKIRLCSMNTAIGAGATRNGCTPDESLARPSTASIARTSEVDRLFAHSPLFESILNFAAAGTEQLGRFRG